MTWFRVDDSLCDHPKVEALLDGRHAEAALALWLLAGAWCARHLTDGQIPASRVRRFGVRNADAAAAELVRVGLWERSGEGFAFHDWHSRQPTRAAVLAEREAAASRVRAFRERKKAGDSVSSNGVTAAERTGEQLRSGSLFVTVPPTRPDPTRPILDHDRTRSLDLVEGDALDGGDSARGPDRGPTPAGIVEAAYVTALGRAGGVYRRVTGDTLHFRAAAESIRAVGGPVLRDAAAAWCADFVAEFQIRTPRNLASYAQNRAARGGRAAPVAARGRSAYAEAAPAAHFAGAASLEEQLGIDGGDA